MENRVGTITLFGSGENSTFGRQVHELLIRKFAPPVQIGFIETPAGFEENPHFWYQKLEAMLKVGLKNFKPQITRIEALNKTGKFSVNNPKFVEKMKSMNYIHTGAGSPTYATRIFKDSLVWNACREQWKKGSALSFASAASVAIGKYTLPVYEIFKVGEKPHWKDGLNLLSDSNLNLTIIPHWNNKEGGKDIDTSRCFIGKKRFLKLEKKIIRKSTILGIDEFTAVILFPNEQQIMVVGKGNTIVISENNTQILLAGTIYPISVLTGKKTKSEIVTPSKIEKLFGKPTKKQKSIDYFPNGIRILLDKRNRAKKQNDFKSADKLRQKLGSLGYEARDTKRGQLVYKIKNKVV